MKVEEHFPPGVAGSDGIRDQNSQTLDTTSGWALPWDPWLYRACLVTL